MADSAFHLRERTGLTWTPSIAGPIGVVAGRWSISATISYSEKGRSTHGSMHCPAADSGLSVWTVWDRVLRIQAARRS
jgi:hypothetical protein